MGRLRSIIIVLSLFFAAVAGYGAWKSGPKGQPTESEIARLIHQFGSSPAAGEIDLSDFKSSGRMAALVNPESILPHPMQYPIASLQALAAFAASCNPDGLTTVDMSSLAKALVWHRFLCNLETELPRDFFQSAPWIHPSGSSFAFLAFQSGRAVFREEKWLDANSEFLHLRERAKLVADGALRGSRGEGRLAAAPLSVFLGMSREEAIVLGDADVFVRRRGVSRADLARRYAVYPVIAWRRYLSASPYTVRVGELGRHCPVSYSALCWSVDDDRLRLLRLLSTIGASLALGGIACVAASTAGGWALHRRRFLRERERMYLHLAHELRTPIANLKLLTESFRRSYDRLPATAQKDFLLFGNEVERLQALAEASAAYLDPNGSRNASWTTTHVALGPFITSVLDGYGDRVKVVDRHAGPIAVAAEPYWLSVCIKNLVDNALQHGAPPVVVEIASIRDSVTCSVSDGGNSPFKWRKRRVRPIKRGAMSSGLGLGLSITLNAARRMGGDLSFRPAPSTFTLHFPRA